ncbi:NAD(P)H-dependent glycerol-3-phosphate dehydrogenase [Sandaracinobacteroides saxicola]|uniref:Glycerol-3-phosphate dehydrogenase [NAD(P)+] n=1 Tax=Sandaracinobacteroides saxicola TaxID=2759707 RepID=A0A7G5IHK4_9SPHN|nr:NAD(P)H-dependent glycerol-3-phosphate dehydrogenase [Sandaracinobacteroides saxicola]QMW22846.1 NAD(P)-dependent glycerol-3-phosphate dehydrogenase [Sandaracinobacteroides saxicola]
MSAPLAILGAGAWGTALAQTLAADDIPVLIWAREPEVVRAVNQAHENPAFLPGVPLHANIRATGLTGDLASCPVWLVVTPAQHLRATLAESPVAHRPTLILCAKGIEARSLALMSDIAAQVAPASPLAVLSGPSFAREVAEGKPTAVTLACADADCGERLARTLARPAFRPYWSDDVIGAEIGGAVKNVLAIACGVVIGAGLGENARAAVIARGFAEMTRFGLARGARAETLAGLSGLGDLVLTCGSTQSRNFTLGHALGQGQSATQALAGKTSVAEGAATAPVLVRAAQAAGVDMPIAAAVAALLTGSADVRAVTDALLSRPLRAE